MHLCTCIHIECISECSTYAEREDRWRFLRIAFALASSRTIRVGRTRPSSLILCCDDAHCHARSDGDTSCEVRRVHSGRARQRSARHLEFDSRGVHHLTSALSLSHLLACLHLTVYV
jgi:hypothetical protein